MHDLTSQSWWITEKATNTPNTPLHTWAFIYWVCSLHTYISGQCLACHTVYRLLTQINHGSKRVAIQKHRWMEWAGVVALWVPMFLAGFSFWSGVVEDRVDMVEIGSLIVWHLAMCSVCMYHLVCGLAWSNCSCILRLLHSWLSVQYQMKLFVWLTRL